MSDEPRGGEVFAEHILDLRAVEFDRMKILEARGALILRTDLAVLGAAAVIATFTLGRSHSPFHFSPVTAIGAVLSLSAFVLSVVYAMRVQGGTSTYMLTSNETLDKMVGEKWRVPADEAAQIISKRNVESIQTFRPENELRAGRLKRALSWQIAFILTLVLTGAIEIIARMT